MQRKPIAMALAFAGTIGLAAAVPGFAADTGDSTNSKTGANAAAQTGTSSQTGTTGAMSNGTSGSMSTGTTGSMPTGTVRAGAAGGQSFDKTGDNWATDYATKNNGRITRKAYMDEMGRRWDAMDRNQQGLTPAEVSRIYGNVDSAAGPARTGSGVQGGNMGPGNQKAQ
jgi:hypothetical protein